MREQSEVERYFVLAHRARGADDRDSCRAGAALARLAAETTDARLRVRIQADMLSLFGMTLTIDGHAVGVAAGGAR